MSNRQGVFFVGTRGPISGSASRVPGESIVITVSTRIIGHCTGRLRLTSGWVSTRTSNRTRKKYKVPSFEAGLQPRTKDGAVCLITESGTSESADSGSSISSLQSIRHERP